MSALERQAPRHMDAKVTRQRTSQPGARASGRGEVEAGDLGFIGVMRALPRLIRVDPGRLENQCLDGA
jgi:hypothetical protein